MAQIAGAQRGVVARWQLRCAGLSDDAVDRMLRSGRLLPRFRGVFLAGHEATPVLAPETAAILAAAGADLLHVEAALDRMSAAALWRLLPVEEASPLAVQVIGFGPRRPYPQGIDVRRCAAVTRTDVRWRDGLPVLSPALTIVSLATCLPEREVERALDEARVQGLLRGGELEAVLQRGARQRGSRVLRALLRREQGPTLTRRQAEERFLALVRLADLPMPAVNTRLHGYEVDFLWAAHRVIVEVDGWTFHGTRSAFERDRRKSAVLAAHGYLVIRVTWRQITEDGGVALIATLAQALARAARA